MNPLFRGGIAGHRTGNYDPRNPYKYYFRRLPNGPWIEVCLRTEGTAYAPYRDRLSLQYLQTHLQPVTTEKLRRVRPRAWMWATQFILKYAPQAEPRVGSLLYLLDYMSLSSAMARKIRRLEQAEHTVDFLQRPSLLPHFIGLHGFDGCEVIYVTRASLADLPQAAHTWRDRGLRVISDQEFFGEAYGSP